MISFEPVDGFFLNLHGHITETSFSADYILCLYDLPIFKVIIGPRYFHFEKNFFHNQRVESNKTFMYI